MWKYDQYNSQLPTAPWREMFINHVCFFFCSSIVLMIVWSKIVWEPCFVPDCNQTTSVLPAVWLCITFPQFSQFSKLLLQWFSFTVYSSLLRTCRCQLLCSYVIGRESRKKYTVYSQHGVNNTYWLQR